MHTLKKPFFWLVIAAMFLGACSATSTSRPTSTNAAPTAAAEPQVVQPSAVPQPSPTTEVGKAWLVTAAPEQSAGMQTLMQGLSQQAGLQFEVRAVLQPADLSTGVRVVVFLTPPSNLNDLLAAAPQTQFVVVSPSDLNPAANLSVIRQRIENQAFLAGFISVLLSTDWRAGGLLPSDGPLGGLLQEAFVNGGHYFCGVCASGWPLGITYPAVASLASASDGPSWQAASSAMFDTQKVEVFYISPEAARAEVLDDLLGKVQFETTVALVGEQTPPENIRAQWAATVHFDLSAPLQQIWQDVLAGKGGAALEAPLKLDDVNPDLLSEGRLRLVHELMDELAAGRVSPYTVAPE